MNYTRKEILYLRERQSQRANRSLIKRINDYCSNTGFNVKETAMISAIVLLGSFTAGSYVSSNQLRSIQKQIIQTFKPQIKKIPKKEEKRESTREYKENYPDFSEYRNRRVNI